MKVRKAQFKIKNTNKQPSKIIIEVPGPPEVNLQNVQDFSKVCRICATITDLVLPIYEGEGLENNVAEKIQKYLPIQVNKTDVLPLVVCYQCTSTLLAWHELVKCCVQADEALQAKVAVETDQETQSTSSEEEGEQDQYEPPAAPAPAPPAAPAPAPPAAPATMPPAPVAAPALAAPAPPAYPRCSPERAPVAPAAPAPPADEITCQYCHTAHPAERFEVHLIREHYESLFHCAECNKYIDKKLFLIHMTMHARQYMQDRESGYDSGFADNSDSGTDVSESPEVPADDEEGVALYLPLLPFREPLRAARDPVRVMPDPVPAEPARMPSVPNPVPAVPKPVKPTARIDEDDDDDDFSDQSDIEFEPLPQSVFEAIEDTEDHQPSGEANTSDEYDDAPTPEQVSTNNNPRKVSKRKKNKSSQCPELVQKRRKSRKRRICPICSKEYTASSSYFYHMKYSHKAAKEFSCEICSAKLGTQASLKQHVASVHATEHQHECKECHKKFRSKASLYIHEQTHQEKKGWSCPQCHLAFRWKTEMQRHLKRHAAEKSYVCETCGRGFNVRYDLLRHARTHTVGKFTCDTCGQTFAQLRYLKVHTSNKHSGNITAKIMHGKK